jgi:hypothetical protein
MNQYNHLLLWVCIFVVSIMIIDDLNEGSNDDNESLEGYDINFTFDHDE